MVIIPHSYLGWETKIGFPGKISWKALLMLPWVIIEQINWLWTSPASAYPIITPSSLRPGHQNFFTSPMSRTRCQLPLLPNQISHAIHLDWSYQICHMSSKHGITCCMFDSSVPHLDHKSIHSPTHASWVVSHITFYFLPLAQVTVNAPLFLTT